MVAVNTDKSKENFNFFFFFFFFFLRFVFVAALLTSDFVFGGHNLHCTKLLDPHTCDTFQGLCVSENKNSS